MGKLNALAKSKAAPRPLPPKKVEKLQAKVAAGTATPRQENRLARRGGMGGGEFDEGAGEAPAVAPKPKLAGWEKREARLERREEAGTIGKRGEKKLAQFRAGRGLQEDLAEDDPRRTGNPRGLYKRSRTDNPDSAWAPGRRMENVEAIREGLGYDETQDVLREKLLGDIEAGSPVDLRQGDAPLVGELQEYARSRLGTGLTPEEEQAIRGRMKDVTEAQAREAESATMAGLTGAGIDPRSGIGASRARQVATQRGRELADIEREITLQDLARKGDIENFATSAGGLGERAREFNVGAEEAAGAHDENALYALAGLESRDFDNLLDYAESGRQAKASRKAAREAAEELEPGALEWTGTILGSLL